MTDCVFVPAHEPWGCSTHNGVRTSLDEPQCDIARPAEPLNDARLDNIRQGIAEGRNPSSRYITRRLLATIDALRAAPSTPEPSGLHEAVMRLREGALRYGDTAWAEQLDIALRPAPSTEPALDVEALADWFCMNLDHPDHDPFLQPDHCDVGLADAKDAVAHIAAERARLAESQP